ncbi:MAG TPA: hypothetical protein VF052_03270 [Solirubrobacterales bacterium]
MDGAARGCDLDRLPGYPAVDLADRPELLGRHHELYGRNHPLIILDHPQEQLVSHRLAAGDVDDALRVNREPIAVERIADPPRPFDRYRPHRSPRPGFHSFGHLARITVRALDNNVRKYGKTREEVRGDCVENY